MSGIRHLVAILGLPLALAADPAAGAVRYVSPTGGGGDPLDGTDWAHAYSNIQQAAADCVSEASTIYLLTGRHLLMAPVAFSNAVDLTVQGGCTGDGTNTTAGAPTIVARHPAAGSIRLLLAADSRITCSGLTLTNGFARDGASTRGFAVRLDRCRTTLTNCVLRENNSNANSDSGQYGTAIYAAGGALTLRSCSFTDNRDTEPFYQYGGAIYALACAVTSVNTRYERNLVSGNNTAAGSALALDSCTNAWVEGCLFASNAVSGLALGGVIYAAGSPGLVVTNCRFAFNGASPGRGAVFHLSGAAQSTRISSCSLSANGSPGGPEDVSVNTANRTAIDNTELVNGSRHGVYMDANGTLALTNCLIAAQPGHGVWATTGRVSLASCTVADCGGWGLTNSGGATIAAADCILWGNRSGGATTARLTMATSCAPEDHSDAGSGNITNDPLFAGGYYLSHAGLPLQPADSPCVDAGGGPAADRGLDARTTRTDGAADGGTVDMGYHYAAAFAEDLSNAALYVDAALGSDSNSGLAPGPGGALKTITEALRRAIDGSTIHVAAGRYSAGGGECFPLAPADNNIVIRGTNRAATVIDAQASGRVFTVVSRARFSLEGLTVTNGLADNARGGGLYGAGGDVTASNCCFVRNTVRSYADPGLGDAGLNICAIGGRLTLVDCDVDNGARAPGEPAYHKKGVGIYAENASVRLIGTTVRRHALAANNGAAGAGLYIAGGDAWLAGCSFHSNTFPNAASGNRGAAVYALNTAPLAISNCTFAGNGGSAGRGTVYLSGAALSARLTECAFQENGSAGWSDDVFDEGAGLLAMIHTTLSGGSGQGLAKEGAAGLVAMTNCLVAYMPRAGVAIDAGTATLANVTSAGNGGWGLTNRAGLVTVTDSVFWDNVAGGVGGTGSTAAAYTDSQEPRAGPGNASVDPLFVVGFYLSAAGLPSQSADSPIRDAGSAAAGARGLDARSTRTDGAGDDGTLDPGYHYPPVPEPGASNATLYVDAAGGSDANSGWTPAEALRTVSAALARAVDGSVINVAAGQYSAALGESFPLAPQDYNLAFVGAGRAVSVLDAGGTAPVFRASSRGRLRFEGLAFTNGYAYEALGGGLSLTGCRTTMSNCWVVGSRQASASDPGKGFGGVGAAVVGGTLTAVETDFDSGANLDGNVKQGGGLYCSGAAVALRGCGFRHNRLATSNPSLGAGAYLAGGSALVDSCRFESNSIVSTTPGGAGLYASGVAPLLITNCTFAGNGALGAGGLGGGLRLTGAGLAATVTRCTFRGNTNASLNPALAVDPSSGGAAILLSTMGSGSGAGIYKGGAAASVGITNCLVHGHAHAILVAAGTAAVVNCTLAGNGGWGVTNAGGSARVVNSIAWSNGAGGFSGCLVSHSDAPEPQAGPGNRSGDPLFEFAATNNYRLLRGSPCINAGLSDSGWMPGGTDLDGRPRLRRDGVDMGAYESDYAHLSAIIVLR